MDVPRSYNYVHFIIFAQNVQKKIIELRGKAEKALGKNQQHPLRKTNMQNIFVTHRKNVISLS